MKENIKDEIRRAVSSLADKHVFCRELPDSEGEQVFQRALTQFVKSGDRRWWWEDFKHPSTSLETADAFLLLPEVVPDRTELLWFIAEDDQLPFYPVYESNAESISRIVGACYGFEYYLVQKAFGWLLCENHHNLLIGVGPEVETRLRQVKAQQSAAPLPPAPQTGPSEGAR